MLYPTLILRCKAGSWEETDVSFFRLFDCEHHLHRALFLRRHDKSDIVQVEDRYIFIWR